MKLLIVDDEEITRTGLISSLDWGALNITEIYQADDGVNGLTSALEHHPDIILCDVRMPRMDGITMLERIEARLPDVAAIFMSGYSDKEYLKAAIQLKAINYIEKPIDLKEIETALRHAVEQCGLLTRQRSAETVQTGLDAEQLAFSLTVPYVSCRETVDELCRKLREHCGTDRFKNITTFIVKLERVPEDPGDLPRIYQSLREFLAPMRLHVIYSEKRLYHIVYHVYGKGRQTETTLRAVAEQLNILYEPYKNRYIAIGDSVCGIASAYRSYESAVILLQSSFFFEPDAVLTSGVIAGCLPVDPDLLGIAAQAYGQALADKNEDAVNDALDRLQKLCFHASGLMPNQVKTVYYDLFSDLYRNRRDLQLLPDLSIENHENIMDIMDSCFSFSMLHELLTQKTASLFSDMKHSEPENATIYLIRNYIGSHYQKPGLSVKDISEYVHLSASYACTFFKNETGTTLNQYITEFRMEKAKQLLEDPRYRIADISAAVGFSDGNYFGKSFRRYTGLSPSEYREKVLR